MKIWANTIDSTMLLMQTTHKIAYTINIIVNFSDLSNKIVQIAQCIAKKLDK